MVGEKMSNEYNGYKEKGGKNGRKERKEWAGCKDGGAAKWAGLET